jgi:hypothetical protein
VMTIDMRPDSMPVDATQFQSQRFDARTKRG